MFRLFRRCSCGSSPVGAGPGWPGWSRPCSRGCLRGWQGWCRGRVPQGVPGWPRDFVVAGGLAGVEGRPAFWLPPAFWLLPSLPASWLPQYSFLVLILSGFFFLSGFLLGLVSLLFGILLLLSGVFHLSGILLLLVASSFFLASDFSAIILASSSFFLAASLSLLASSAFFLASSNFLTSSSFLAASLSILASSAFFVASSFFLASSIFLAYSLLSDGFFFPSGFLLLGRLGHLLGFLSYLFGILRLSGFFFLCGFLLLCQLLSFVKEGLRILFGFLLGGLLFGLPPPPPHLPSLPPFFAEASCCPFSFAGLSFPLSFSFFSFLFLVLMFSFLVPVLMFLRLCLLHFYLRSFRSFLVFLLPWLRSCRCAPGDVFVLFADLFCLRTFLDLLWFVIFAVAFWFCLAFGLF